MKNHLESKLEKLEKETDDNATVPPPPGTHYMVGSNDANKTHPGKRKRSVQVESLSPLTGFNFAQATPSGDHRLRGTVIVQII